MGEGGGTIHSRKFLNTLKDIYLIYYILPILFNVNIIRLMSIINTILY